MMLRTKTLSAALAMAISAGGAALAQDAATPAPVQQGAGTQQSSEPSAATAPGADPELTDEEIRERMSGNLCRCGAYVGILDAVREVAGR